MILTVKIKNRHPAEVSFSSEFLAICNHCLFSVYSKIVTSVFGKHSQRIIKSYLDSLRTKLEGILRANTVPISLKKITVFIYAQQLSLVSRSLPVNGTGSLRMSTNGSLAVIFVRIFYFKNAELSIQPKHLGNCSGARRLPSFDAGSTRGSAIAERPARRSVSVKMLSYCCTNNANRFPCVSVRSTFNKSHVLFRYMHQFVHASSH